MFLKIVVELPSSCPQDELRRLGDGIDKLFKGYAFELDISDDPNFEDDDEETDDDDMDEDEDEESSIYDDTDQEEDDLEDDEDY